jgi:hypothetical protein
MPAQSDFDAYCQGYLEQWEQRATVRHLSRTRLTAEAAQAEMFPAAMQPTLAHAEVVARGAEARHRLLARATATFMLQVAVLEVDLVTSLCIDFINKGAVAPVPESARQVALTVSVDEAYHAYVAREFLSDLERHTGVVPSTEDMPMVAALQETRRVTPPELQRATETMMLCFAENFVTEELFGLSKEAVPQGPFHTMMREHMMDEGRHQIFFQKLFRHIWNGLAEDQRTGLGQLVAAHLDGLLTASGYVESQVDLLEYIGFDHEAAARIAREAMVSAFGTELPRKSQLKFMRSALHLVEVSGILDHAPTRQTLVESGWVDA